MIRTTALRVVLVSMILLLGLRAQTQDTVKPAMANNAILIGWDGAHRDHVKNLLKEGKLPNLQKIIAEGTLVDVDVTSGATDTKAGWTQILTGYKPAVTGVYNNGRYRDVPEGYSIFERLRAAFGAGKVATVAVIGKKAHCGEINPPFKRPYDPDNDAAEKPAKKNRPKAKPGKAAKKQSVGHVVEDNGQKFLVFEGSPYYTMHKSCDEWEFGLMQDAKVGDRALAMLDKYAKTPLFFFVHFAEVDHSGHKHGEPSREYDDAIISGDTQLGRIVEKLKSLGIYEKTLIYVTADHGFDVGKKQHKAAPYVFLATNDKQVMRGGCRADITPTILARLGVDPSKVNPPLDGEPLLKPATKPAGEPVTKPQGKPKPKATRGKAKARA
jgi:arylsulfatase A-like enzyme